MRIVQKMLDKTTLRSAVLYVSLWMLVILSGISIAAEKPAEIIAAMKAKREELKTGRYSVSISDSSKPNSKEKGECTFDFTKSSIRHDRVIEGGDAKGEWKSISTPEFVCRWLVEDGSVATINRPGAITETGAIDVRCAGLLLPAERYEIISLDELMKSIFGNDSEKSLLSGDADGLRQIAFIGGKNKDMRRSLAINTARGSTAESVVFEHRLGDKWSDPQITVKTAWKEMEKVWIPVQCEVDDKYASRTIKMEFNWKSVNAKISPEEFDVHSFSLPKGTIICDKRLGFDYLVERIGDKSFKPGPAKPTPRR